MAIILTRQGARSDESSATATPLWLATEATYGPLLQALPSMQARWAQAQGYTPERHRLQLLPTSDGGIAGAIWGLGALQELDALSPWDAAPLPEKLPAATFELATPLTASAATQFVLGWLLGSYRFCGHRSSGVKAPTENSLLVPEGADLSYAQAASEAIAVARDLINTPANELGPQELAAAARDLSAEYHGECTIISGEQLAREYPLIAAVGAGSARAPLLVDCRWPRPAAPRVTLVGKGVCFDSGGLDLKPSSAMLLMKKDMGGAACVLGLARLLLRLDTPIELRVLIPAVENSVSGSAYRPGDILRSRRGLSIEIGNTDAEGRLVLADALAEAEAGQPDLLIDMATLTGAARTALGPDLPALFSNDEALAQELIELGRRCADPVWMLPLWAPYEDELSSRVADLNNVSASSFAGAIIAALFLKRFVGSTPHWLHLDLYAWNPKERPGRPLGAEAQGVRALYQLIRHRYG